MSKESGTIKLSKETKEKLAKVGLFGETYDDVVSVLIEMLTDFKELMDATSRSEAEVKAVASKLSGKYNRRIRAVKG